MIEVLLQICCNKCYCCNVEQFITFLSSNHLRATVARKDVFLTLLNAEQPLSIADIIKTNHHIDRTSVYRTLQLFTELSIIELIPFGWKTHYELSGDFKPHHHHLLCSTCGDLTTIKPSALEHLVMKIADQKEFVPVSHHFEIYGTCKKCQIKKR